MIHYLLPASLPEDQFLDWLEENQKEKKIFDREIKYTEEELNHFARKGSELGIEINELEAKMNLVKSALKKGNLKEFNVVLPQTQGIDVLTEMRKNYDYKVKRGCEIEYIQVYGIVDHDNEIMVYVTEQGEEIEQMRRPLTKTERHNYIGPMFMKVVKPEDVIDEEPSV